MAVCLSMLPAFIDFIFCLLEINPQQRMIGINMANF